MAFAGTRHFEGRQAAANIGAGWVKAAHSPIAVLRVRRLQSAVLTRRIALAHNPPLPFPQSDRTSLRLPLRIQFQGFSDAKNITTRGRCARALSTPAWAEDATADEGSAETIIVVGQRDAPIEIEPRGLAVSLGAEQLEAVNAFNTEDLMKYAPNFFVRKRYSGDSNGVPGFRGTHSTQSARTLVMVDGFVVSNFLGNSFGFAPKWGVVGPGEVKQFDIVYGPYSARYIGNSMGGIVNITTRDPQETEALVTTQGFVQPYKQFSTNDDYYGYSAEAGFGWKQKDGPFSVRLTARYFRNDGHPMTFLWADAGNGCARHGHRCHRRSPTSARSNRRDGHCRLAGDCDQPHLCSAIACRHHANQVKLKVGYDDGAITGQALFAYWHNVDSQFEPDCYLRDAAGNLVCEGKVTFGAPDVHRIGCESVAHRAQRISRRAEVGCPIGRRLVSTGRAIDLSDCSVEGLHLERLCSGQANGAGTLADQGPTGWYTGDLIVEQKSEGNELAAGLTANHYQTDLTRFNAANWRSGAGRPSPRRPSAKPGCSPAGPKTA